MISRPDVVSMLWPLSSLFLFAPLIGQVRGIARASRPVVFSYSSVGNSNHPAVLSHHYRPLPVDPPTRPPDLQIVEQFSTLTTEEPAEYTETVAGTGHSPEEGYMPDEPSVHPEVSYSSGDSERDSNFKNNAPPGASRYRNRQPHPAQHVSSGQMYHDNSHFGKGSSHEGEENNNSVPVSDSTWPVSKQDYRQQTNRSADRPEHTKSYEATPDRMNSFEAVPEQTNSFESVPEHTNEGIPEQTNSFESVPENTNEGIPEQTNSFESVPEHTNEGIPEHTNTFGATPGRTNSVGATPVVQASTYQLRGGLTYTPTPIYDELGNDHNIDIDPDYISTTPLPMFESIRNKLPSINEYPPPNRGYITFPFTTSSRTNSSFNNKILQRPKYFAYSNDIPSTESFDGDEGNDYDVQPAHSHKKAAEKHVKGGGQEHHSNQQAADGGEGEKGYELHHKHDSGDKGHHDKETHKGKYKDEKGISGKKKEQAAHYDATHQAEKGKKSAKYGESGEHKKGHSTRGEHNVHTKDEYLKKHEFYDEHHEGGDHEKSGGFKSSHGHKKASKKKKGHRKAGSRHQHRGKKGFREKGGKLDHRRRHKDAMGADDHYKHHKKYWSKGGRKQGKKWGFFSPGNPEK